MTKHRWLCGFAGLILLVLIAVVGIVGYQAATLKSRLTQSLGNALKARVEVTSLSLDFFKGELHAAGITLTNRRPDAPWDRGEISQAVIHFHLRDLFSPSLPLSLELSSWRLNLRPASAASTAATATPTSPGSSEDSPAPNGSTRRGVRVTQLSGTQGTVEIDLAGGRQIVMNDVAFQAGDNGGDVWTTQLQAASISVGSLTVGASSTELRSSPDKVTFSDLRMQCGSGIITGEGDVGLDGTHTAEATLKAVNVPMIMLVAVQWQMKLSGQVSGTLSYHGDDATGEAQGQLSVSQGKFNLIPFLGKMASLVGLPDITGMEVDKATADFDWKDRVLHLRNIDVRKNDVTRIAGEVDVAADAQVDGHLKIGLPDAILARWPQLQSQVFSVPLEDYGWAEVHLTGTPDHLQEDLSSRVLAAGIQGGNGLINQGTQKAMDLLKGLMGP